MVSDRTWWQPSRSKRLVDTACAQPPSKTWELTQQPAGRGRLLSHLGWRIARWPGAQRARRGPEDELCDAGHDQ